jgi:HEPN domain-containing protein
MNREMAKAWLASAASDLETMEAIVANENLTHVVAFHAQQAVEKSLKALLELYGKPVPKTHSILRLGALTEEFFPLEGRMADLLDKLYIDARYPGDLGLLPEGKPSIEQAQKFFDYARTVYAQVRVEVNRRQ